METRHQGLPCITVGAGIFRIGSVGNLPFTLLPPSFSVVCNSPPKLRSENEDRLPDYTAWHCRLRIKHYLPVGATNKGSPLDVMIIHERLPQCAQDARDGDEGCGARGVQTGFETRQEPALPDDTTVEGMTIVDTEARAAILLGDNNNDRTIWMGRFSMTPYSSMS